jgi:alcohol dehydrogenase
MEQPMRNAFQFDGMPKLFFKPGIHSQLPNFTRPLGNNILLITGARALLESGKFKEINNAFQAAQSRVSPVTIAGEPSPHQVDKAVRRYKSRNIDAVVAIGGGSVLDAGKAIAAMLTVDGSVEDFLEGVGTRRHPGTTLPLITVPTTSGTGSEATKNAVISKVGTGGFKKSLRHDNFIPAMALLDPVLCTFAPPNITAACGMDAFTQLLESYVSISSSPLTDALAFNGMQHLCPALPAACTHKAHDLATRGALAYAAFLSGVTLAHAGLGIVHGLASGLGAAVNIPHGVVCANLLAPATKVTIAKLATLDDPNARIALTKYAQTGRLFDPSAKTTTAGCRVLVKHLYQWIEQFNVLPLGHYGLAAGQADNIAVQASCKNNPVALSIDEIKHLVLERI